MKKLIKLVVVAFALYVALVVAFESLLGYFQPEAENTLVITTFDADGVGHDRVLTALDGDHLYVAVNHWPRAWYRRAMRNPEVRITRGGETASYTVAQLAGEERDRVAAEHPVGARLATDGAGKLVAVGVRALMGFAPRHILRLDPVAPAVADDLAEDAAGALSGEPAADPAGEPPVYPAEAAADVSE